MKNFFMALVTACLLVISHFILAYSKPINLTVTAPTQGKWQSPKIDGLSGPVWITNDDQEGSCFGKKKVSPGKTYKCGYQYHNAPQKTNQIAFYYAGLTAGKVPTNMLCYGYIDADGIHLVPGSSGGCKSQGNVLQLLSKPKS